MIVLFNYITTGRFPLPSIQTTTNMYGQVRMGRLSLPRKLVKESSIFKKAYLQPRNIQQHDDLVQIHDRENIGSLELDESVNNLISCNIDTVALYISVFYVKTVMFICVYKVETNIKK